MPELPFLTVLAENLERRVQGRTIREVLVPSVSVLKTVDPAIGDLRGAEILRVRRRGKFLLLDLGPGLVLVMHLMRNGRLQVTGTASDRSRIGRANRDLAFVLALDDGSALRMIEMGPKKAASVWLVRAGDEATVGPLGGLGMEPESAEFGPEALARMLAGARMRLKPFLTAQRYLAGIGNTYADEILWQARLGPQAVAAALSPGEIERLHDAILATLRRATDAHRRELAGALPMKEPLHFLSVHRHGNGPCPRCGTPIAVVYYEDRETYYCPACQTGGKVYADRRRSRLLR